MKPVVIRIVLVAAVGAALSVEAAPDLQRPGLRDRWSAQEISVIGSMRLREAGERPKDPSNAFESRAEAAELGRQMFSWLFELDELGVDDILVEGVPPDGVGRAVMDRLGRAATHVRGAGTEPRAAKGSD